MNNIFIVCSVIILCVVLGYTSIKREQFEGNSCIQSIVDNYPDIRKNITNERAYVLNDMSSLVIKDPSMENISAQDLGGCVLTKDKFDKYGIDNKCMDILKYNDIKSTGRSPDGCVFDLKTDDPNNFYNFLDKAYTFYDKDFNAVKTSLTNQLNNEQSKARYLDTINKLYANSTNIAQRNVDSAQSTIDMNKQTIANFEQTLNDLKQLTDFEAGVVFSNINGVTWKFDGANIRLLRGTEMKVKILENNTLYRADAMFFLMQNMLNGLYLRHAGYILHSHNFTANNYDYAWRFIDKGGLTYEIYNDYGGGFYLGYDSGSDQVLIVPKNDGRRMIWRSNVRIPDKYLSGFVASGCEGEPIPFSCPSGTIKSGKVWYGRWNNWICTHPTVNGGTGWRINQYSLDNVCTGKSSCDMQAPNRFYGDPYGGVYKHVDVVYKCG